MKIKKLLFFLLFFLLFCSYSFAQKKVILTSEYGASIQLKNKRPIKQTVKNKEEAISQLELLKNYFVAKGYLSFSVDSVFERHDTIAINVFLGNRYNQAFINVNSPELLLLKEAGLSSHIRNGAIPLTDYKAVTDKLIYYYENNGFPFITVSLDSIVIDSTHIVSLLKIEKNNYITFDSIIIKGNSKLSVNYLYPYLGLKRKKPYSESIIRNIPQKMASLPFVNEIRKSGVEFVNDKAYLYLFIDKRKNNQADGYLGIVPVDENNGKVSVNGELNLSLKNIFSIGESIGITWRSIERYSQYLDVKANFPYLFKTPFGIDGNFVLEKKDTSYLTMNFLIGIQYSFWANSYAKLYYNYITSNVLSSNLLVITDVDLSYIDYHKSMYGLQLRIRKLDYIFNPQRGFDVLMDISAGHRNIIKNSHIDENEYTGLKMQSVHYRLLLSIDGFIPIHKHWSFVLRANYGSLFGEGYYKNELFKIGGVYSLQGFDEDAFTVSDYVIATTEIRFLFAKYSYLNLFFNGAWYEQKSVSGYRRDIPYGFGLGITFNTKAGIFYLSYALGSQQKNPVSFKTGKIHFGIKIGF